MKFNFKIQQYQTDAVEAIVNVFNGQGYFEKISYIRDLGKTNKKVSYQMQIGVDETNPSLSDFDDDTGYKNEDISLTDEQLLKNVHEIQTCNNIKLSPELVKDLGKCCLDIEMETGERVIIVMGAVNVMKPRVSGTLNKYILCIA